MRILLVTGLPGTGKTTLARLLAQRWGAPLLAKDLIKEPLLDVLGAGDAAHSRRLSDASFAVLFTLARHALRSAPQLVLEGNFRAGEHEPMLRTLGEVRFHQVLCRVPEAVRVARLAARADDAARHAGHGDRLAPADASNDRFLDLPGPRQVFGEDPEREAAELLARLAQWR